MASETIRSFLVELGFKQDETSLHKFESGITKATKAVTALAGAIEATAVVVATAIAKWSSTLEQLYFAAQRTGSSATALKALDQAAQQLGAGAGDAAQAVESLAAALRTNPGNVGVLQGLLGQFGMDVKTTADGTIDAVDALLKLSEVFKKMPYQQVVGFGEQLGIQEGLLNQIVHGNLLDEYGKSMQVLSRGGFQHASEKAHEFMHDLRLLGAQLEVFGTQVYEALESKFHLNLNKIRQWFDRNGDRLAKQVADIAQQIIRGAEWIAEKIVYLVDKLKEWDEKTDGLSTKLIALALILKGTGIGSIVGGILSLAGAMASLGGSLAPVVAAMTTLYGIYKVFHAAQEDQNLQPGQIPNIVKFKQWMNNLLPEKYRIPQGILNNNPGNLEYRGQSGAIQLGRFAGFASEGEGLFQLGRQLELFYSRGLNTIQAIISKYAPAGENNVAAYIADVAKRTGFGANQALNLSDPAVLANMMNAVIAHEQGYNPYAAGLVRHEADTAIDYVRGTSATTVNNSFHISGANAREIANEVESRQRQAWIDATRNLNN